MRKLIPLVLWVLFALPVSAQVVTVQSGDWDDPSVWSCACVPSVAHNVEITSGFVVTIPEGITGQVSTLDVSQGELLISFDGLYVSTNLNVDAAGLVTVASGGVLENQGSISLSSAADLVFQGSEYIHNQNGGTIPTATWNSGSTCRVAGVTTTVPSGLGQSFHHFTWNSQNQAIGVITLGSNLTTINGNFVIEETNNLFLNLGGSGGGTLSVGGDMTIGDGEARVFLSNNALIPFVLNVAGDLRLESAATNTSLFATQGNGIGTINVMGDFVMNAGIFDFAGGFNAVGNLNLYGDFYLNAGAVNLSQSSSQGNFNFVSTGTQQFIQGSGTLNTVAFTVSSNTSLDAQTYSIGSASSSLHCDGTLILRSVDPLGAFADNLNFGSVSFGSGAVVEYAGAGMQFIGADHPSASGEGVDLRVNNGSGVTMIGNVLVSGDLILENAGFFIDDDVLTLEGIVVANANALTATTLSNFVINGSGAFGSLPLSGTNSINALQVDRGGSFTIDSDLEVGTLDLASGNLILTDTLSISGDFIRTSGVITPQVGSALVINGTGSMPSNVLIQNNLPVLTMNRVGATFTTNSNFQVSQLNLIAGQLNNTGSMTIADGGTIVVEEGTLQSTPGAANRYHVVYSGTGSVTTGPELPLSNLVLEDLTIETSGSVMLDQDVTILGDLIISGAGTLSENNQTLTLTGDLVVDGDGDFSNSTLIFSGVTSFSGPTVVTLGNFTLNAGATLVLPPSNVNVAGDIILQAGATLDITDNMITLVGDFDQSISGNSHTLNNLDVNNSGNTITLLSALAVQGILNIQSASELISNGFLRLLSSSDGPSGNASIASLSSGGVVTGNVFVERYMSNKGQLFRYLSSPVLDFSADDLNDYIPITGAFPGSSSCGSCTGNPSMFFYDSSVPDYTAFPVIALSETMEVGRGYATFIYETGAPTVIEYQGIVNQGTINIPLGYSGTDTWNLVGNPYPATLDWDLVTRSSNVSVPIAVRDNGVGGFAYWDGSLGDLAEGRIAHAQAFWVEVSAAGQSITIEEEDKDNSSGAFLRTETPTLDYVRITLSNPNFEDHAYVRIREGASNTKDKFDATKLDNTLFDLSSYSLEAVPASLAINALSELPCGTVIPLKTADLTNGNYVFSLEAFGDFDNLQWKIHDTYTDEVIFLGAANYTFQVTDDANSKSENRFELSFDNVPLDLNLNITGPPLVCNTPLEISVSETQSTVDYRLELNDILLEEVYGGTGAALIFSIDPANLLVGSNTLRIRASNGCSDQYLTPSLVFENHTVALPAVEQELVCGGGIATLSASGASEGATYNWYAFENGGAILSHHPVFETGYLVKSATYYVSISNAAGCESNRVPARVTVMELPSVVISESENVLTSSSTSGNQWFLDGEPIPGGNEQSIAVSTPGVYKVVVTLNGCSQEAAYSWAITGLESISDGVVIFPNPFVDVLHVKISGGKSPLFIGIRNALGQHVGEFELLQGEDENILDTSGLVPGFYIIQVIFPDQTLQFTVIKD